MIIKFSPKRVVSHQTLKSNSLPEIAIEVDDALRYLGEMRFTLIDVSRVELFLFAESVEQVVQRLFVVQFESYLPDNNFTYQYDPMEKVRLGEHNYLTDSSALKFDRVLRRRPEGDIAHWLHWLKRQGYDYTRFNDMIYQRFVRILDKFARSEMLMLYFENLSLYNLTADDLLKDGIGATRLPELRAALYQHFSQSIKVTQG